MANKPFAIQGADLTLGGVNLSAGTTGVVIPGVTQAANYLVEEVERLNTTDGTNPNTFGSDAGAITVIDNAEYVYRSGGAQSSGSYDAATYSVDELDDGEIEEINVETVGVFLAADKTRVEAANMWATTTPDPLASFNTADWTQIPFRPKMRAGLVENVGGNADTGNFTFDENTISNGDGLILVTNRGTLAIGTNMETPGVAGHFHIGFDGSNSQANANDLFLGDDYNYVKLPGYELNPVDHGVEIGTHDRDGGNNYNWRFGTDGSITFPDGTIQTTAYTGGSSGAIGTFFVVVNDDGTVSKSTDGVSWTTGADQGAGIGRVATNGVTVAMIQSDQLSWTTFAGLEASTYVSGSSGTADEIGGETVDWTQIDYAGGYFVAVGSYTPTGSSFTQGVYGYSTDGRIWTFETVDQTVVEFFGNDPVDSDWGFSDVDYNGAGWMFSVGDADGDGTPNGGGVYITDLTATVTSARCFSMNITYRAAWNGSAWYMEGEDSIAGVNTNLDPRNGTFAGPIDPWATGLQDLGLDNAGSTVETAGGNGYIAAGDSDGHVAWSDDNGTTWHIVTPIPYTRTISAITQASPAVVASIGGTGENGEKVVISGSSVSGYNGTFYWKDADSSLYTDQILDTPFDTSGLAPFTGTATLTWSNGTYIDAMDYINGYFYIGNDDEQIARTTDFVSWTILDDQGSSEFEYWNDIAGFVGTGGDKLVNGSFEVVLDSSGNLTADGDIKTGVDGGRFIQDCGDGTTSMRWINVEVESESTQLIRAYSGDPDDEGDSDERAQVRLDWQDEYRSGLTIRSFDRTDSMSTVSHDWNFAGDGDLYIPPGKTIRDAMTGDDLLAGGGSTVSNVWVQTFESATPLVDTPLIALSVEYDSVGNVIALFYNVEDSGGTFYSVGKYTASGTRIWTTRFATGYNTDGWGLAVDPTNGFIYVAGKTNTDGGQEKSTLTKIASGGGAVEWSKTYAFGVSINSNSQVVDVASDGNPVMVGFAVAGADTGYVTTTKVDAEDGSIIWSKKLDGQADEEAYGMAVGPTGEVVAVGYMDQLGLGSTNAVATVVTVPSSNVNWTTQYGGGDGTNENYQDIIFDIIVTDGVPAITIKTDPVGNRTIGDTIMTLPGDSFGGVNGVDDMVVNVASVSSTAGSEDNHMLVVKYNSAGAIQWQKAILFDAGLDSTGADADIDSEGNVYVCGQYEVNDPTLSGVCMNLVKFNSAGVKQWSRRVEGACGSVATSIVVGADDKLYLSGSLFSSTVPNPGPGDPIDISCVVAKYNLDGTVVWQRLLDNTELLSVSGSDFLSEQGGGSNLAVKQDYVALAGGFGTDPGDFRALIAQLPAAGDLFTVSVWDFKASSLTGILDTGASDITVVDADKTNTDNISNITVATVTPTVDSSAFLIGTLYSAPDSNNSLVNNGNQLVLESTGTLTLPQGGTITEGYVTSNPTIQLTPASPSVASQKLVIKGGGSYPNTENGIYLSTYTITWAVSDTVEFYVYDPTRANETLYWWIVPEGAGISTTMSGTVALDGIGDGNFTFTLDSDAYEFRVRVSPENNNYDPDNVGVESVLINGDEPTFEGEHHLHLTTGNLTETSIFLGTDDHNVRTTTDGNIEITTPGIATVSAIVFGGAGYTNATYTNQATTGGSGTGLTVDYLVNTNQVVTVTINQQGLGYNNGDVITIPGGSSNATVLLDVAANNVWEFDTAGTVTLPQGGVISETEVNSSHSILLTPKVQSGENPNMAVRIYPTFADDDHIHITAGNPATVDLFLGDDIQYVKLEADGGNVVISADDPVGIKWTFGTDGTLTLPKNSSVEEVTPATGAAKNVIVIQSASSILNTSFASLPPAPVNNYNVPGTGIVVNVTWNTNGEDYHAPAFVVVDGGTGHTGGGESGGGDVLTVPYVDMGISGGGNWTWYVVDIASDVELTAGLESWTFGGDGSLTFPDATVQSTAYIPGSALSTVAKTGVILPTTTGIPLTLSGGMTGLGVADGTYGPFTLGGVTFSVTVAGGGISGYINISSTTSYAVNATIGQLTSADLGDPPGNTTNVTVDSVVQATPTAIDLTKSVNKLTDGVYTLANGVEGQIMYLVAQNGTVPADVGVVVANSRNIGEALLLPFRVYDYSDDSYYDTVGGFCTLIFTDGAWQQTGGAWEIIT